MSPKAAILYCCVVWGHSVRLPLGTLLLQVGYRASKEAFGHTWDMKVSAGEKGRIFTVSV
jgi:hypothetical protein